MNYFSTFETILVAELYISACYNEY